VIILEKTVRPQGKEPVVESHFYISSLDPDTTSPEKFQQLILQHWELENCLHGQKDRFYGEDRNVCGDDWGVAWTVLSSMALSLARLMKKEEKTLKEIRERSAFKPMETARKIGLIKKTC
jgi:predicted transposase YbfD/YdcC